MLSRETQTRWLDTALADQPVEAKARVLDLLLRYGIDPENEFFMIFTAIGQLQVLIEDSPQDWQALFASFEGELHAWTQTHLQTLEALSHKAETTERLAGTTKELGTILLTLVESCNELMQRLNSSDQRLINSISDWSHSLKSLNESLDTNINDIQKQLYSQQALTQATLHKLNQPRPLNALQKVLIGSVSGLIMICGFFVNQQEQQLQEMRTELNVAAEQTAWLLQKANRRDCQDGLLTKENPICQSLP